MKKSVVAILSLLVTIGSSMAFANDQVTKCPFAIAAGLSDDTTQEYSPAALPFGTNGSGLQSGRTKKKK
ncbi:MAG: hypothetical protein K2X47_02965 [Bdellovibrionales bacterium]|nr:hypothetical protein [Bdellovibrionales bacterium]